MNVHVCKLIFEQGSPFCLNCREQIVTVINFFDEKKNDITLMMTSEKKK